MARKKTGFLQPVQHWINGTLGKVEGTLATAADLLDDPIPVGRASGECRKHDHIEMAFENFTFHT